MSTAKRKAVRVIGLGNDSRGDDAVGRIVVRELRWAAPDSPAQFLEESGEGLALMESWKGAESVILVDAVHSGQAPGVIHRFDVRRTVLPDRLFHYSSHAFGVAEAVELARVLQQLPPNMVVYGIEGRQFESGAGLSPEVKTAMEQVKRHILKEIGFYDIREAE